MPVLWKHAFDLERIPATGQWPRQAQEMQELRPEIHHQEDGGHMIGAPFLVTPESRYSDQAIILSDLKRIQDLRLFLKSCQMSLQKLLQAPRVNIQEIERVRVYVETTHKEIRRLEQLITLRGWGNG